MIAIPKIEMTAEEFAAYMATFNLGGLNNLNRNVPDATAPTPKKRKISAYNRRYKAAFKRLAPKYKKANGQWKANGFRSAVRAAHKEAKK